MMKLRDGLALGSLGLVSILFYFNCQKSHEAIQLKNSSFSSLMKKNDGQIPQLISYEANSPYSHQKVVIDFPALIESDEQFVESESIEPGDRVVVIDSPVGRLGISVCYDLRFPELYRAMVDRNVEVIALPAAFTAITGRAHWETLVRARAIENLSYVIAAAQGGFHIASRQTFGHSMIVDPWGTKLALRERGNGCVVAEIDPDFQHTTRRNFPCLDHRRLHCR